MIFTENQAVFHPLKIKKLLSNFYHGFDTKNKQLGMMVLGKKVAYKKKMQGNIDPPLPQLEQGYKVL